MSPVVYMPSKPFGADMCIADLIRYCARENVPFTVFEDWSDILKVVKKIHAGETTVHEAAKQGYEDYQKGAAGLSSNGQAK